MKQEYYWIKSIIKSPLNKCHHRPALLQLVSLYHAKWSSKQEASKSLLNISVLQLKRLINNMI